MSEKRNLLEEDGRAGSEENVGLENLKYSSRYIVFGPVGFLRGYWQDHFDNEIVRTESLQDKQAAVIRACPKQEREENHNVASIWIDRKDFSILRIQWEPQSILNYEEKTIRFPSKQIVQEVIVGEGEAEKRHVLEKTEFSYAEYKFFRLRPRSDISAAIRRPGISPLPV